MPLAARDNLQQVAAFEMDRQTPFTVDQVHYAVRELARERRLPMRTAALTLGVQKIAKEKMRRGLYP